MSKFDRSDLVRLGAILLGGAFIVSSCAHSKPPPAPVKTRQLLVAKQKHSKAMVTFLSEIHQQLNAPWNKGVRGQATHFRSAEDPLNDHHLAVAVAVSLRPGKPTAFRVSRASGNYRFDNTALQLMARTQWPPLPPDLRWRHITIVWHFFRDGRGCAPEFARVESAPLEAYELFRLALERKDAERAWLVLGKRCDDSTLVNLVVQQGLAHPTTDTLVLQRVVEDYRSANTTWEAAVASLIHRAAWTALTTALDRLVTPSYGWRPDPKLRRQRAPRRAAALIALLHEQKIQLPKKTACRSIKVRSPSLAKQMLPYCDDAMVVTKVLEQQ
ncbi:MAG: energy transducer TonB, partial [Deltaproteobacteria bacterium]|nr:energy transducer TonB [Deltaproteobacteria bacterium]